jgi:hypothetical protein
MLNLTYTPQKWNYGIHPSVAMVQKWLAEIETKTGKSVDEWMKIINNAPVKDNKDRRIWLKEKFALGTNTAWWLADRADGSNLMEETPEAYLTVAAKWVSDMFAGKKAALYPLYDSLMKCGYGIAIDVKACPCRTMVPLYRNHVFAQIKPSTNTRIDLGLALKGVSKNIPKRLLDTGGIAKGDRITHRIPISNVDEIDDEVIKWMKVAYELDK